jgi:hypothetical protein
MFKRLIGKALDVCRNTSYTLKAAILGGAAVLGSASGVLAQGEPEPASVTEVSVSLSDYITSFAEKVADPIGLAIGLSLGVLIIIIGFNWIKKGAKGR